MRGPTRPGYPTLPRPFASPNVITAPVTQVDASTHTNGDLKTVSNSISNVGGIVQALQF